MKAYSFRIITTALLVAGLAGCAGASATNSPANPAADTAATVAKKNNFAAKKTMRAFRSEQELKNYFHEIAEKQKQEARRVAGGYGGSVALSASATLAKADKASFADAESVTNVQVAGVDEGGIVKGAREQLVFFLSRGGGCLWCW